LLQRVSHLGHIPLALKVYEQIMPVFQIALGVYFQSSYYVAKAPVYKQDTVFFDRFCYDYVSLFGINILFLDVTQLELITRKVYSSISYNFSFEAKSANEGVGLIALECIRPAFKMEEL
jgi:hypothetical protein